MIAAKIAVIRYMNDEMAEIFFRQILCEVKPVMEEVIH